MLDVARGGWKAEKRLFRLDGVLLSLFCILRAVSYDGVAGERGMVECTVGGGGRQTTE